MFKWLKKIIDFLFPPYHPTDVGPMDSSAIEIMDKENIKTSSRKNYNDNYYDDGGMTP